MKAYTVFSSQSLLESFDSYQSFLYRQDPKKYFYLINNSYNFFSLNGPDKNPLIITDNLGKKNIIKYTNIKHDCIVNALNEIDKKFWETWSLPKMIATKYMAKEYTNIIYFNYDILLKKELPKDFLTKDVFALKKEEPSSAENWGYKKYLKYISLNSKIETNNIIEKIIKNINFKINNIFINTDLFGGNDMNFIKNYVDLALNNILDFRNEKFWLDKEIIKTEYGKACILDQFMLTLISLSLNKKVILLEDYAFLNDLNINTLGKEKVYFFN